jgi:hypothetical protein
MSWASHKAFPVTNKDPIPSSERGAAMLAALCLAMVFVIVLSSYITLCYTSLKMSTRNMMASHAVELAEAGLEQALYAQNVSNGFTTGGWTTSGGVASATMTMTSGGFVLTSTSPTALNMGNGVTGQVYVQVSGYATSSPIYTSTATLSIPNQDADVIRTVTTTGARAPVFVNAVAATTGTVRFQSAGLVDSYNSALGPYSSPGTYSAVILSQRTTTNRSVRLNNAVLQGYAVGYDSSSPTMPPTSTWFSPTTGSTTVKSSLSTGPKIDTTRLISNPLPYQPTQNEALPNGSGNLPAGCCVGATNVMSRAYTFNSPASETIYYANGINLTNATVQIQVPVVIILYGNLNISGTGSIQFTAPGASLLIFAENGSVSITSTNGINNTSGTPLAKRCVIMSTTNNNPSGPANSNTVTFATNNPFYGELYFPYLPVTIGSTSPATTPTIYGSIVGSSVTFATSPAIHYDTALRNPDATLGDEAFSTYLSAPITAGSLVDSVP